MSLIRSHTASVFIIISIFGLNSIFTTDTFDMFVYPQFTTSDLDPELPTDR